MFHNSKRTGLTQFVSPNRHWAPLIEKKQENNKLFKTIMQITRDMETFYRLFTWQMRKKTQCNRSYIQCYNRCVTETVSWDRSWIHPQSLALLTRSLVGQAPNGIQIGASVTVEFSGGGKTTKLASSSAKSSSLAVSSQQNSASTVAPSKPTPGSAARGGPILFGICASGLCRLFLGLGSIISWAPPNIWLIGIRDQILKNVFVSSEEELRAAK